VRENVIKTTKIFWVCNTALANLKKMLTPTESTKLQPVKNENLQLFNTFLTNVCNFKEYNACSFLKIQNTLFSHSLGMGPIGNSITLH
jgi:hypothetical protein